MAAITGIAGTGTGQYFVDATGKPTLLRGDTAWGLVLAAGIGGGATTYQTDMDNYTQIRASQGYNLVLTAAGIANSNDTNNGTLATGVTWDGTAPFSSPGVLNGTYWARVDYLIASAAAQGMTVHLLVCDTYSLDAPTGPANGWTNPQFTAYGTALGTRYGTTANLMWHFGQDGSGSDDAKYTLILNGIRGTGDTHQVSVENYFESTSRTDVNGNGTTVFGTASATINWCYSYNVGYDLIEVAYGEANPVPVFHGDGPYDPDINVSYIQDKRAYFRSLMWWALSSGSRGFIAGRLEIWPWTATSVTWLSVPQSDNTDFPAIMTTFSGLFGWQRLVPDLNSKLVTAGRGSHAAHITSGTAYTGAPVNTYVSASITSSGDLAVMYLPDARNAITVNPAQMLPAYTANWYDPATGAKTSATIASTYSNSTLNSAGGHDWVLALQCPGFTTWRVP